MRTQIAATIAISLLAAVPSFAQTTVSGKDAGISNKSGLALATVVGSSNYAANLFDTTVTGTTVINFESGNTNQNYNAGTRVATVNNSGVGITITNADVAAIATDAGGNTVGFNTTASAVGNGNRLYTDHRNNILVGQTITFDFSPTPINAFGAYFSGLGTAAGTLTLNFTSGGSKSYDLSALLGDPNGGAGFFGVYGIAPPVSTIVLNLTAGNSVGADVFSVDDIRFRRAPAAVPEPSAFAVAGIFAVSMVGLIAKKRKN